MFMTVPLTNQTVEETMWPVHTMEHNSALKREEIPTPATTRMNVEDTVPSEISPVPGADRPIPKDPLPGGPRGVRPTEIGAGEGRGPCSTETDGGGRLHNSVNVLDALVLCA